MTRSLPKLFYRKSCGFTLVELLVTIAILAILLGVAAPSFKRMVASNRMTTKTNEFVTSLNAARSEVLTRGKSVTFRSSDDDHPNDFHRGWQVFTDINGNGSIDTGTPPDTVLRAPIPMSGTTTIVRVTRSGTAPSFTYSPATSSLTTRQVVIFNSRGGTANAALFRICDSVDTALPGRIVQVSVAGRISLDSTSANCAS